MINRCVNRFYIYLFDSPSKSLCIPISLNPFIIPDYANFFMIPFAAVSNVIVCSIKVKVVEKQTFNPLVIFIQFGCSSYNVVIFFMNDFIGLYIESPITFLRNKLKRFVGFSCQYYASFL